MYWSRKQRKTLPTPCHCFQIMLKVTQESLLGVKNIKILEDQHNHDFRHFPKCFNPSNLSPNFLEILLWTPVWGFRQATKSKNNNAYSSKTLSRLTATRLLSRHQRVQQLSPAANEDLMVCTSGLMICETKKKSRFILKHLKLEMPRTKIYHHALLLLEVLFYQLYYVYNYSMVYNHIYIYIYIVHSNPSILGIQRGWLNAFKMLSPIISWPATNTSGITWACIDFALGGQRQSSLRAATAQARWNLCSTIPRRPIQWK